MPSVIQTEREIYGHSQNANDNITKVFKNEIINAIKNEKIDDLVNSIIIQNKNVYRFHKKLFENKIIINLNYECILKEGFVNNSQSVAFLERGSTNKKEINVTSLDINKDELRKLLLLSINRFKKFNPDEEFYVWINVPSFKLRIIKNQKIIKEFRVIVGKEETPTPLLKSHITKIIINPKWIVPSSILEKEILNLSFKDTNYLNKNNFYITNLPDSINIQNVLVQNIKNVKLIQKPGSKNALGRFKFHFENPYLIYVHDTPNKKLFNKERRDFSHGCIRIENPEEFARYLLNYNDLHNIKIDELIKKDETKVISLKRKIPIYITYMTCEIDDKNDLIIYSDIYNLDRKEYKELFKNFNN